MVIQFFTTLKETKIIVVKAMLLLLSLSFYSTFLGRSDLGFRAQILELKLDQKFPPAIAFEIIDSYEESAIKGKNDISKAGPKNQIQDQNIVHLKAEVPKIRPLTLDIMTFGSTSEKTSIEKVNTNFIQNTRREASSIEDLSIFTEEEKMRLRISGLDKKIDDSEFYPVQEKSIGDRIRDILNNDSTINDGIDVSVSKDSNAQSEGKVIVKNNTKNSFESNPKLNEKSDVQANTQSNIHYRSETNNNKITLRGEIEFSKEGELHYNYHTIDVRHYEEGLPKEIATVDLDKGTFTVDVKSTKGYLIGKIINSQGRVEGEGIVSISDLLGTQKSKLFLQKKGNQNTYVNAKSLYGGDESTSILLAGGSSDDYINKMNFDNGSEVIVEAKAKNHRSSISAISYLGGKSDLFLLPDKMVKGLIEILYEMGIIFDISRGDSMIYGQVQYKGRPAEGVSVISGLGQTSYFGNFYLPEPGRNKTSENGIFVTTFNNTGHPTWNEIYLDLENGQGVHINALVYPGKVTQLLAEIPTESTPLTLRSFDAFSGEPVRVKAEIQQLGEVFDTGTGGSVEIELPKTHTLSYVKVSPDFPYEKLRLSYTHILDHIHIPLVSKEWIDNLKATFKINEVPETGMVLGFIQGDDFIVDIPNKGNELRTIYFDAQGFVVPKGVAGGGFLVFNLDEDIANIIVVSQESHREAARIIRPDSEYIQVLNVAF